MLILQCLCFILLCVSIVLSYHMVNTAKEQHAHAPEGPILPMNVYRARRAAALYIISVILFLIGFIILLMHFYAGVIIAIIGCVALGIGDRVGPKKK